MDKLNIYYKGKVNRKVDDAIEKGLKELGYRRWASGYCFGSNMRDLAFDRTEAK